MLDASPVLPNQVPEAPQPDWLEQVWTFIVSNPQAAASYGTLISATAALFVALITFRQMLTSRKMLDATREGLEQSQQALNTAARQADTANEALRISEKRARRDRLDTQAPLVSVSVLPGSQFVLTDCEPTRDLPLKDQFERENKKFDRDRSVPISRTYPYTEDEPDIFWLTGRAMLRNEGSSSARVAFDAQYWQREEGDDVVTLDDYSFLLTPKSSVVIRWMKIYILFTWLDEVSRIVDQGGGNYPDNPTYNFKYLGLDGEQEFLKVESTVVPDLTDRYDATMHWLPLVNEWYRGEEQREEYQIRNDEPIIHLCRKKRSYPLTKVELEQARMRMIAGLPLAEDDD